MSASSRKRSSASAVRRDADHTDIGTAARMAARRNKTTVAARRRRRRSRATATTHAVELDAGSDTEDDLLFGSQGQRGPATGGDPHAGSHREVGDDEDDDGARGQDP